ncbi:MAG: 1-deoxy-D-xylulose-5-phosphate synthase [Kiritimatiellae bacterium]|nr:1-deoxy-D-xylulose-5-phosphate synthase [Kiritimatiellia bacterium]
MRNAFINTLVELAAQDQRIILLTGDLGFMALEPFAEKFPERFFNVGVAEQNMVGMATGLAEAGFIPYVYSIDPFAVLRPYEFIRNGPIYHQLPVRIVGVGGGLEYGHQGITHYGLEDVGVLRVQPGIAIIAPADAPQAVAAIRETWNLPGPVFYRLSKNTKAVIPGLEGRFEIGRIQVVCEGKGLLFIAMGAIASEVAAATTTLHEQGINCGMAVIASINPPPTDDLIDLLKRFHTVVTVEAHYVVGGIGSLVSEVIAEHGLACRVIRCGVKRSVGGITGSQSYLEDSHGLSAKAFVKIALGALSRRHGKQD